MQIEAKPTTYKGVRFRSRLEARWAVFLEVYGESWEYERYIFSLPNGWTYTPDFWLPDKKVYLEVKPVAPTPEYLRFLDNFQLDHKLIITIGDFYYPSIPVLGSKGLGFLQWSYLFENYNQSQKAINAARKWRFDI